MAKPSIRGRWLLALLALMLPLSAWAIDPPLRRTFWLPNPRKETFKQVRGAKVVFADYDLLKHDFPVLRDRTNEQIDQWLLQRAAVISIPQAAQSAVNTPIATTDATVTGYRPWQYGRAAVLPVEGGLLDVKGTGALAPSSDGHGTGLMTVGEAIREYAYERLVRKILAHAHASISTVRTYAVIDGGFDQVFEDGNRAPAGMLVRQAHTRNQESKPIFKGQASMFGPRNSWLVERMLRPYGITSCGSNRDHIKDLDLVNIQGTGDYKGIVDFGHFIAERHFDKPAVHVQEMLTLAAPDKRPAMFGDFPQPDPKLQVPWEIWGYGKGKADPKYDNPWIWAHELAQSFRNGTATRADAAKYLGTMLDPVDRILAANPRPEPPCRPGLFRALLNRLIGH